MKFDYDKMYATTKESHFDWVKRACLWKANVLCQMIHGEKTDSILEVGTGRGDVLNACHVFKVRIGADISSEALEQHRKLYGTEKLIKIDANAPLPFSDNEIDFVLLCDILEHVENPIELLAEAARVGRNVMLKIPIEKSLLKAVFLKLKGIKYGARHPSGHLHSWRMGEVLRLIDKAGLKIIRGKFVRTPLYLIQKKNPLRVAAFLLTSAGDIFTKQLFLTRLLLGGSYFAIARKKTQH